MTGSTPATGAVLPHEDGPGGSPTAAAPRMAAAGRWLIGRQGDRPAALVLRHIAGLARPMAEVVVADPGGQALLTLGPFELDDVVATWRSLGAASGLPLVVEGLDGRHETVFAQIGPLRLGAAHARRRRGLPDRRRPRFLMRRKTGRLPPRPAVIAGRELVCGARR